MLRSLFLSLCLTASALAWSASPVSRHNFLQIASSASVAALVLPANAAETLPSGVVIEKTVEGSGPQPVVGDLAAIRFRAFCGEMKIDDIFDTPEPYYTRVGSGGLIKGVEEVLPMMRVGDRWKLTIPGNLAFGKEGRKASAGRPRIPADSTIVFDVEIVGLPGKEVELIDLIGDV